MIINHMTAFAHSDKLYSNESIYIVESTLMSDGNYEHAFHMGIWQADIEITLEKALESNTLSDWLVNSASMCEFTVINVL